MSTQDGTIADTSHPTRRRGTRVAVAVGLPNDRPIDTRSSKGLEESADQEMGSRPRRTMMRRPRSALTKTRLAVIPGTIESTVIAPQRTRALLACVCENRRHARCSNREDLTTLRPLGKFGLCRHRRARSHSRGSCDFLSHSTKQQ